MGAGNKPAPMIIGALIVKHKINLSDEETILTIQENPYMQYMLGLSEYTEAPVFDLSLFVTIRKRLQISDLNGFTGALLKLSIRRRQIHPEMARRIPGITRRIPEIPIPLWTAPVLSTRTP